MAGEELAEGNGRTQGGYPESKYLQYLPAIYADARESGPFVGQFLVPFEAEFEGLRDLLAEIDHFFSPALTSTTPDFLSWLAGWVALTLDESWDTAKRRQIIAEAVVLYRLRGTVKGLQRFLEIYTGYVPVIQDGLWPGGFQITVASRLPVIEAQPSTAGPSTSGLLDQVETAERREPVRYDDYYVVRTSPSRAVPQTTDLPEGHPLRVYLERLAAAGVPLDEAGELKVYYRADKVAEVQTGKDPSAKGGVSVRLVDGRGHHYRSASIIRQEHVVDERYDLTERGQVILYRGDAYLIATTPLPYRFTVDLALPCVPWRYCFEALALAFKEKPPPANLPPDELEQRRAEFLARLQKAEAERAAQLQAALADLAAGRWPDALWDDFDQHEISLPPNPVVVQPDPSAERYGWDGPAAGAGSATPQRPSIGWSVSDTAGRLFVLALQGGGPPGGSLQVYEWVACREWTQARQPDYVRRIRAIIDEVRPAHTIYSLRMTRQEPRAGSPGGAGSPGPHVPVPGVAGGGPACGGQIGLSQTDLGFGIGVRSVIC